MGMGFARLPYRSRKKPRLYSWQKSWRSLAEAFSTGLGLMRHLLGQLAARPIWRICFGKSLSASSFKTTPHHEAKVG